MCIQSETLRSQPRPAVRRAVPSAHGLANLVLGNGVACRVSVDAALRLETSAQRSRHALAPREQSVSRYAAALYPRTTLSLPILAAGRQSMVETRSDRRMVTRSLHRRCRVSSPSQCDGLARLKDRSGTCRIKNDAVYEVCFSGQRKFSRANR